MADRYRCFKNNRRWWWNTPHDVWHEVPATKPSMLPDKPACYVIQLDGTTIYVGQTVNLKARFFSHGIKKTGPKSYKSKWGELQGDLCMKVRYAQRYGDWAMREMRLINRLAPRFNARCV